jgi:hypothetical protein
MHEVLPRFTSVRRLGQIQLDVGDAKDDANVSKGSRLLSEVVTEVFSCQERVCKSFLLFSFTYERVGFTAAPDNIEDSILQHGDTNHRL